MTFYTEAMWAPDSDAAYFSIEFNAQIKSGEPVNDHCTVDIAEEEASYLIDRVSIRYAGQSAFDVLGKKVTSLKEIHEEDDDIWITVYFHVPPGFDEHKFLSIIKEEWAASKYSKGSVLFDIMSRDSWLSRKMKDNDPFWVG